MRGGLWGLGRLAVLRRNGIGMDEWMDGLMGGEFGCVLCSLRDRLSVIMDQEFLLYGYSMVILALGGEVVLGVEEVQVKGRWKGGGKWGWESVFCYRAVESYIIFLPIVLGFNS